MPFKLSFCDPFKPDIVELGDIHAEKIIESFEKINWADYLKENGKCQSIRNSLLPFF